MEYVNCEIIFFNSSKKETKSPFEKTEIGRILGIDCGCGRMDAKVLRKAVLGGGGLLGEDIVNVSFLPRDVCFVTYLPVFAY